MISDFPLLLVGQATLSARHLPFAFRHHCNKGSVAEALQSFRQLVEKDPLYVAAYYQMGTLLLRLGEIEEAKRSYSEGIKVAVQKADWHAKSELEAALESL